jgi:hypothetical protein
MTRRPLPPESTPESTPPDDADPMLEPARQFNALAQQLEQLHETLATAELQVQQALGQALQVQGAFLADDDTLQASHPADLEAAQLHLEATSLAMLHVARLRRFIAFWVDVPVMQPREWDAHREVALGTLADFRP